MRVSSVSDAVGDRVTHARVLVLHVHLHSKRALTFCKSALAHFIKVAQIIFDGSISPGRVDLLIPTARHLLRILEAHVGLAYLDKLHSVIVELLEVV